MLKSPVLCVALAALLAAAGCTRSTSALNINTQSPPQPLPSAPSGNLNSSSLDPISQDNSLQQQGQIGANGQLQVGATDPNLAQQGLTDPNAQNQQVASLQQPETQNAQPLTHEQLAGAWNVSTDSAGCRVFLSFTQWSGGYRAGSRQCLSEELASISAWDVKQSSVVLVDSNGNQVATLASAGNERYVGRTSTGQSVSFSR